MGLSSDPAKQRQWQKRSQQRAQERTLERMRERGKKLAPRDAHEAQGAEKPPKRIKKPTKRHNDGPWRNACIALYGEACMNCGDTAHVEMDHVIPKSQDSTVRADVEDGLPLCGAFSRVSPFDSGCHKAKTDGKLRFRWEWFTPLQLTYLADKGYVRWDEDGNPYGLGYKHFEPRIVRAR